MVSSWKMTAGLLAGLAAMAAARKCPAGLIKCIYVGPDDECYNICTPLIGECTCPPKKSFPSLGNGPPVTLPNTDSGCTTKLEIKGWKQCGSGREKQTGVQSKVKIVESEGKRRVRGEGCPSLSSFIP